MTRIVLALVAVFVLSSCAAQTFHLKGVTTAGNPSFETSQPFFIHGLGQDQNIMAKQVCGSRRVTAVQVQQTFLDGFLGVLTFGLYTPRTARVWCK